MLDIIFLLAALLLSQPTTAPTDFPGSWAGTWRGPCTYTPVTGPVKSFDMELHIAATDDTTRFQWQIVYEDGGLRQVRPYELIVVDASKGEYVIDEKNSIRIGSRYIDGALYGQFDVGQVRITASYRLEDDRIIVELITTDPHKPDRSGGEGQIPAVDSLPVRGVQRAVLQRQ